MKQTQSCFTVFDTTFNLTLLDDCKAFIDALEEMGQIRTWQLYDMICTVEGIQGNRDDYQVFLEDIAREFGTRVINVARENCLDECAAKTILSQYSRSIAQYFRTQESQPFVHAHAKQSPVEEGIQTFSLPIGTATEANYVPVQQVEIIQREPHYVSRVVNPVKSPICKDLHIGNIDSFKIWVHTFKDTTTKRPGGEQYITDVYFAPTTDFDAEITDEMTSLAGKLLDDYMSSKEA